ncbi:hypothetical protein BC938DRAFT_480410 [Jimgerdemannia flammicorona]|uniref:Uncharacterized protein n=1 Tax=Jimgerdemannia flammicorona TaxID=994334 RepID=A0A433QIQ9_9FUNG|nr:hypothetical protein BC938DRAFT_480410 [Jimgerdemannia flammicorona]
MLVLCSCSIASDPLTRFLEATSLSTDKEEGRGDMNAEVRVGELSFFSIIDVVTSTTDRHSDRSFGGRDAEFFFKYPNPSLSFTPHPMPNLPESDSHDPPHVERTGMAVCVHHRVRGWADPTRAEQGFNRGDERGEPAAVRRNDEGEMFSLLSQCPMPAPERYILPLNDPDSQSACQIQDKQLSPFLRDLPADAHADHRPVVDAQVRAQVAEVLGRPVPDESVALEEEEDEIVVVDGVGPEKDSPGGSGSKAQHDLQDGQPPGHHHHVLLGIHLGDEVVERRRGVHDRDGGRGGDGGGDEEEDRAGGGRAESRCGAAWRGEAEARQFVGTKKKRRGRGYRTGGRAHGDDVATDKEESAGEGAGHESGEGGGDHGHSRLLRCDNGIETTLIIVIQYVANQCIGEARPEIPARNLGARSAADRAHEPHHRWGLVAQGEQPSAPPRFEFIETEADARDGGGGVEGRAEQGWEV